jgi:hypothetical protein
MVCQFYNGMVCPPPNSEAGALWPRFGLVVVATTSRRDNKVQMIRPIVGLWATVCGASWNYKSLNHYILYENEFQNPQIFQQTISLLPEQSTLVLITIGRKSIF